MDNFSGNTYDLYKDMKARTNGTVYIGVAGPVRTGKSTFIKRFMDLMVLPNMTDENELERAKDELPQSAQGKTIMTTEPKFIPKEAVTIQVGEDLEVKVRMIDCVGYMVKGAEGHSENGEERMVKTPWFDTEIPFTQAAEMGTRKVINDHSTIGIVVTCDGSFSDIERENYIEAEEKTIQELKALKKPFVVLLNSSKPYSDETIHLAENLAEKYQVTVMPVNCSQLRKDDIHKIMETILYEFPISSIEFFVPHWVEMLPVEHPLKADLLEKMRDLLLKVNRIKDVRRGDFKLESPYVQQLKLDGISLSDGKIACQLRIDDKYYYEMLSEMTGVEVENEYALLAMIKELARQKKEYKKVSKAMEAVRFSGYGVVAPEKTEIKLSEPEIMKHGNKYGVKIKSEAPSVHMIRSNVEIEISPIVGSEEQARDLIQYINSSSKEEEGIWDINIFGKSVEQLVAEGIQSKLSQIGEESQVKLQDTMQKIVNDSTGGMICIII